MFASVVGSKTEARLLQPAKAAYPILVTPEGMLIEAKLLQWENACDSILLILLDKMTELKLLQPEKAVGPISLTDSGMLNDDKLLQP